MRRNIAPLIALCLGLLACGSPAGKKKLTGDPSNLTAAAEAYYHYLQWSYMDRAAQFTTDGEARESFLRIHTTPNADRVTEFRILRAAVDESDKTKGIVSVSISVIQGQDQRLVRKEQTNQWFRDPSGRWYVHYPYRPVAREAPP